MPESTALADSNGSTVRGEELIGELRRTLGRMEAALGSISDALVITDRRGRVLWCNQPFERFVQRGRLMILGRSILSLLPGDVSGRPILRDLPSETDDGSPSSQQALLAKNPLRAVAIEWRTVVSEPERPLVFCLRDISVDLTHEAMQREVKRIAEERHHLAEQVLVCPVTGLPNRRALELRLGEAFRRLEDQPAQLALYFCDLNGFKQINDCHGHAAGDALLVTVGERLQSCLRQDDMVARLGGDEFVVLSEGPRSSRKAWDLAARLQEALSQPWTIDERTLQPSMSVGIAVTDDPELGAQELLRRADLAMYDAKSRRDRPISLHDERLERLVSSRRSLGRRLRRALAEDLMEQQGFSVVFRPVVRLEDGVQEGVEAELCVESQENQPLLLPDLLAVADRAGVMPQLGQWLRETALRQVRQWQQRGQSCSLAINLRASEVLQPEFCSDLQRQIEGWGVSSADLILELDEDLLRDPSRVLLSRLDQLRSQGVRLVLDQFGANPIHLADLVRLPIDAVKLHSSFSVQEVDGDPTLGRLRRACVRLALDLGLEVIVDGIREEAQCQQLLALGCRWGQGPLFAEQRL